MYVDGLLAENHGQYATAQWDPALAEMSGSPQPQPPSPPPASTANVVDYANQPYYPGATLPTDNGQYIFYLDVWSRPITWLKIRTSSTRPSGSIPPGVSKPCGRSST